MSFSEDFAASGSLHLFERFADAGRVVATVPGQEAVSLTAIVGEEETDARAHDSGQGQLGHRRTVTIITDASSAYGGIANPPINMLVTVDSKDYVVESVMRPIGNTVDLVLRAQGTRHRTRPQR